MSLEKTTPRYEYSRKVILERIALLTQLQTPFGCTVRYAVKANPHAEIIRMMNDGGVQFDASSSFEASELLRSGIAGKNISLSSQQSPHNLPELLQAGVLFVATSFKQLELFLAADNRPASVGIRINPAMGSGHNNRTNTGGVNSSFGIWYESGEKVRELTGKHQVIIDRLHLHIGSGADPYVWGQVMDQSLDIAREFPDVTSLNIGGGYKVHRYGEEVEADMTSIFATFAQKLETFAAETGRKLHLEIEPGTYFIAHAGTLIAQVDDIVDTGKYGHTFLRLNTGMNDFLRTTLYGAQHRIEVMNDATEEQLYIVVGHNCESGDIFTTEKGDPESVEPRLLKKAAIGDIVHIYDVGAYCASMRARGYNSFPDATEVMVE
jgi:diaminopimelate decarboxylase